MDKQYQPNDWEQDAIALVRQEKQRWEDATAFITERVAFKMRELIRILRKNYWGVFDHPIDPLTGAEKVWIPLTEVLVEAVVKNIDLDTKDINFRAKNPSGYATKDIIRAVVKDYLDKAVFGEVLDETERQLAIDGTRVWKTYEFDGKLHRVDVDLLNCYIDPTSPSIKQSYRFTERSLMFSDEIEKMDGWANNEGLIPVAGLPRTDPTYNQNRQYSNVKMIDVYETWGKIPKYLITHKEGDRKTEVEGRIVVSGIDSPGNERCHLIEENTKKDPEGYPLKPYEEAWFRKISGRWYGKGVAEQVIMIQLWVNTIVNIRINRGRVSQLGLFKIRKGSGITSQQVSRLGSNGAIQVTSMDDIEQFVMQEASQSSYNDEKNAVDWAQRVTSAFEIVTGESLPASTPATNAAIQNKNAMSAFGMVKESIGMFLQRWMDRHALPMLVKTKKREDIVRIVGDDEKINKFIEHAIAYEATKVLDDLWTNRGHVPSEQEVQTEMMLVEQQLRGRGEIFMHILEELVSDNVDTSVAFTNENFDPAIISDKLMNMLSAAPEYRAAIIPELFNVLGLDQPKAPLPQAPMPGQPGQGQLAGQGQNLQQLTTQANTPKF